MVNTNLWYNFINSFQTEASLKLALINFTKYLGFEGFQMSNPLATPDEAITEVRGFDDRRIFLSVHNENDTLRGKYVITDKNNKTLDIITFKADGFDWIEEDEK